MLAAAAIGASAADFDPYSASIEENINTPAIGNKAVAGVTAAMTPLRNSLNRAGFKTSSERNGLVVMVTIPAADLFAPNGTDLTDRGREKLAALKPFVTRQTDYKILIAVHSDDTGDQMYAEQLTADRANAIDDFFGEGSDTELAQIVPYGLGDDEPVAANNSIAGRARNRRVEIYFVPLQQFIDTHKRTRAN